MANTPKWAPKPKPEPQSVEARKLDDLLDAVKIVGSAIASIDTRPVVDLSGLPTPKVEVQPAPVVQQSLDVKALAEALREVLNIEIAGPDLSGLDAILKRAIEEMPRGGGGGGGRSAVKLNNRSGQSVNPATAEGLADLQASMESLLTSPLQVADYLASVEHEEVQSGADGVLTFTLSGAVDMVMVDVDPTNLADTDAYVARATVDGTTPTATVGFAVRAGQTTYLPLGSTGTVKVYAPSGVDVAVHGLSR